MSNENSNGLSNTSLEQVKKLLENGKISVCVVGIGRIGLPTALYFANSGLKTIGVDINSELVEQINSRVFVLQDEPGFDTIFEEVIKRKKFEATTKIEETIPKCDLILLSLPTPMDIKNIPDYSPLLSVGKSLSKLMKKGCLVVVESTVEPGFIEDSLIPTIEGTKHQCGKDFSIAACPENANPGQIINDFKNLPRLIGAINSNTTEIVYAIYDHVFGVELIKMPNCKTANAAKLTTNVFRDVNIAFINELAMLFEKLGIDIYTVLEAAKKKYNFQIHFPGAGVGGPCLPVNSYQLIHSSSLYDNFLKIVKTAREINEGMSDHVVELLLDAMNKRGLEINNSTITILGISYKPNVKDVQISPAEPIIKKLEAAGAKLKIFDPYFKTSISLSHTIEDNLQDAITDSDSVIIITSHDEFRQIDPNFLVSKMKNPILIDCTGIIDSYRAKKAGIVFRGIGRGETKTYE